MSEEKASTMVTATAVRVVCRGLTKAGFPPDEILALLLAMGVPQVRIGEAGGYKMDSRVGDVRRALNP